MTDQTTTFDIVRELGLALPGAVEERYYRLPALKVDGEMFVVQTGHRSAEPNSIGVAVGYERREQLMASDPEVFYLKPHYEPYPVVLVRLDRIKREALRQLLASAHQAVASGSVKPGRRRKAS